MTTTRAVARCLLRGALLVIVAAAPVAAAQDAAALRARHVELRESLAHNGFQRPLHLESTEQSSTLTGEVHALMPQAFAVAGAALRDIAHWCDILILHPNIKDCRSGAGTLHLSVGRLAGQDLAQADRLSFSYEVAAATADYLRVVLKAPDGPFGTRRYRIVLEVASVDDGRSFLRFAYAYRTGAASRWALRAYLATLGRAKVGFSVARRVDGRLAYIGGMRGMVERNAMRCYLAIEAYLVALAAPAAERTERRLHHWHAGVAQFPQQLEEGSLGEYLAMKRREIGRQQAHVSDSVQTLAQPVATLAP